jgi:hypothetical protein
VTLTGLCRQQCACKSANTHFYDFCPRRDARPAKYAQHKSVWACSCALVTMCIIFQPILFWRRTCMCVFLYSHSAAFSRIFSGGRVTPRSPLDNKAVFSSSVNADAYDAPTELMLLQGAAPPRHLIPAASLMPTQPESLSESLKAGLHISPSPSSLSLFLRCPSGPQFLSSVLLIRREL